MGNFLRGLLFGLGLGLLFAPKRGQEQRRFIRNQFQKIRGSLPENVRSNSYTSSANQAVQTTASTLKSYTGQAASQVKDTASTLGNLAQQATAQVKDTASKLGDLTQQATSHMKDTAGTLSDLSQQATTQVKDTAGTLGDLSQQATTQVKGTASTLGDLSQQATAQVKDTASNLTQQTTAQVKDTAVTPGDLAQQATSQVQDTAADLSQQATAQLKKVSRDVADTAAQGAKQAQQRAQDTISPATRTSTDGASTEETGTPLRTIPGIEPETRSKLEAQGIHSTQQLLKQTTTREMRTELAQKAGIGTHMLRTLIDRADLMRLSGIQADVATLLEEAGVNGCKDLQRRNPENLYATLISMQETSKSAALTPSIDQLTRWVADATALTHADEA